jgi:hypothetical protein
MVPGPAVHVQPPGVAGLAWLSIAHGRVLLGWLARAVRWPGGSLLFALPLTLIALPLFGMSSAAGWD